MKGFLVFGRCEPISIVMFGVKKSFNNFPVIF